MLGANSSLSGEVGECWESSVGQELAKLILFDMYMVTFSAGSAKIFPLRSDEIVNCGEFFDNRPNNVEIQISENFIKQNFQTIAV